MKKYAYYLYDGDTYYEDKKTLKFINVKDPTITISYVSMDPDEVEKFKEVLPNERSKPYRTADEKLFRVLTDISTVIYLTKDSFDSLVKKTNKYLQSIEDYERMCVLRDVVEYYILQNTKKRSQIEDYIKHFNKLKK